MHDYKMNMLKLDIYFFRIELLFHFKIYLSSHYNIYKSCVIYFVLNAVNTITNNNNK